MPARRPRIDTVAMPVAGLATHAKPAGLTTIFFEDEPVPVAAPSKPAYAYKETGSLLSWLPPVDGADAPREQRYGRRHVPVPGDASRQLPGGVFHLSSFLQHHEYPPQKPRHARARIDALGGTGDAPGAQGTRPRARARGGAGAAARARTRLSPGRISSKDAAMLLPPIHARPELPAHDAPSWAVKSERPPFKAR
ncbi:hypothetical protein KFE25_001204 [Diacronema lutheri]|uniref:Uncharacterized protein n=1 Tax=Diacronema lutheri TaxID=2081491 RepID=A0A8J6C9H5_DIALT|nr:hypothetical protein KFE25_001204 [Diacronema lutheri]